MVDFISETEKAETRKALENALKAWDRWEVARIVEGDPFALDYLISLYIINAEKLDQIEKLLKG